MCTLDEDGAEGAAVVQSLDQPVDLHHLFVWRTTRGPGMQVRGCRAQTASVVPVGDPAPLLPTKLIAAAWA
ncbi:MAG: hypothetical protein HOE54_01705 [Gammaproteobacteria bacterium]|nr:hypothetical protein [Gammaproteobacteria bacterium]